EEGFVGVGTDISERQLMQQTLQHKSAFLEGIIGVAPDGIFILDPEGNRIIHNEQLERLFPGIDSRSSAEHLVRTMNALIRHPANFRAHVATLLPDSSHISTEVIELVNGMSMVRYTAPLLDKNGQYHGRLWAFHIVAGVQDQFSTGTPTR